MNIKDVTFSDIAPLVDEGQYYCKWETDLPFKIYVTITGLNATSKVFLNFRKKAEKGWRQIIMNSVEPNRYEAAIKTEETGLYEYTFVVEMNDDSITHEQIYEVYFDRPRARFAAWYEMWPRSQGTIEGKSATFDDMINRLPYVHDLGFDTIYLAPTYPVGRTNKKGPNNSLQAGPDDPGSLYSIGNEHGGHKAVNPDFGTMKDFHHFIKEAARFGIELVLDIIFTCSPDHPWLKQHPEWFYHNPYGTIKYAENPPKKYQDVHPLNFECENYKELWNELRDIFLFWIDQGIRTFRVDNPHTKPVKFWEWIIREIHEKDSGAILLAEAFTEPKMMKLLAKTGFTQSYTYFTWRYSKHDFTEYLTELTMTNMQYYFRGNFFTNTPDILMPLLQEAGRPAFMQRIMLASTLSSVYGMYNGYELCENRAIPGTEEYLNSEKYEYKVWDWDRPGNIKYYIKKLNQIRKENAALHYYRNLSFYNSSDESILFYGKTSYDKENTVLVAVNMDAYNEHSGVLHLPLEKFGIHADKEYTIEELLSEKTFTHKGKELSITLPNEDPAWIFILHKKY
ncbi:MAG: alpha-amylase family glycosyl hydrolase [Candidatus Celaenobacter polaris]|nr:alpha-amylase family glycosyl hydrolase [Candidatus Celaenobacter polaris]